MSENDVKKKFQIIKVYGNSGLVYIFDTNGFHRQGSVLSKNLLEKQRVNHYLFRSKKKLI